MNSTSKIKKTCDRKEYMSIYFNDKKNTYSIRVKPDAVGIVEGQLVNNAIPYKILVMASRDVVFMDILPEYKSLLDALFSDI